MPIKPSRFLWNRHEIGGAFGDIGTDLPLLIGVILASGMDAASALILFGLFQILSGVIYGLPMPVQPLKVMAVLVISQKIPADVLMGGGLAVGAIMLLLTTSGLLTFLAARIPLAVVRGLQFGLGLSLATLALKQYVPSDGASGWVLATIVFLWMIFMRHSPWKKSMPAALLPVGVGIVYALVYAVDADRIFSGMALRLPQFRMPDSGSVIEGLLLLALPQISLSISNSVIATEQTVRDLFPEKSISVKKIGLSYSIMNLIAPFLGGLPVCHGCGGLAGHHVLGARSGTSVMIYGAFFLSLGLFFSQVFDEVLRLFPMPLLGVILLFEAMALLVLIRDHVESDSLYVALLTALVSISLPGGFLTGMLTGLAVHAWFQSAKRRGSGS